MIVFSAGCANGRAEGARRETKPAQAPTTGKSAASGLFDGSRALGHVKALVALGPRPPGSDAIEKARLYIEKEIRSMGLEPKRDPFEALTPDPALPKVGMANLTADIPGKSDRLVIIGGHYDTKIMKGMTFVGANDGGSSAAILLELGRVLSASKPYFTVRLAFFDGEEAIVDWSSSDGLYGSKHMAARLRAAGEDKRVAAMILVDMVGDRLLRIPRERLSTPWLVDHVWRTAQRLGYGDVFVDVLQAVEDDHVPFRQIGIAAADLIDFEYGPDWGSNAYWHTPEDTADKLSDISLEIVGRTVAESVRTLVDQGRDHPDQGEGRP